MTVYEHLKLPEKPLGYLPEDKLGTGGQKDQAKKVVVGEKNKVVDAGFSINWLKNDLTKSHIGNQNDNNANNNTAGIFYVPGMSLTSYILSHVIFSIN